MSSGAMMRPVSRIRVGDDGSDGARHCVVSVAVPDNKNPRFAGIF
jgi:hypothetical protein